jgi:hypothetical protein
MLEFYYDCLLKYIPRNNFALTEIDTDSMYFGLSKSSIIDCVKPELKQEFLNKLHSCHSTDFFADNNTYFPRVCCKKHVEFDKRTPGLFKLEAEGKNMVSLCSKSYTLLKDNNNYKVSAKGITKSKLTDPYTKMKEALFNPSNKKLNEVVGFRVCNNTIKTYEQTKQGLSFFYVKRKVQNDLISTEPLTFELNPWVDCNNIVINEISNNILALSYPFEFSYGGKDYDNIYHAFIDNLAELCNFNNRDINFANFNDVTEDSLHKLLNDLNNNTEWELDGETLLNILLKERIKHDEDFATALLHTTNKSILYCNDFFQNYFSCGLKPDVAYLTKSSELPRLNIVGEILMKLREGISAS